MVIIQHEAIVSQHVGADQDWSRGRGHGIDPEAVHDNVVRRPGLRFRLRDFSFAKQELFSTLFNGRFLTDGFPFV